MEAQVTAMHGPKWDYLVKYITSRSKEHEQSTTLAKGDLCSSHHGET